MTEQNTSTHENPHGRSHRRVPTIDELKAAVVPTQPTPPSEEKDKKPSPDAGLFLRHAAKRENHWLSLEDRWAAIGVKGGGPKDRILKELQQTFSYIRLHEVGDGSKIVEVTKKGLKYLGRKPPKGSGRGGYIHQFWVDVAKRLFKSQGYSVKVEGESGIDHKRVDLIVSGSIKIGIEVSLTTSVSHEIKNLKADLRSGMFDFVIVASPKASRLKSIRRRAMKDPVLAPQMSRIKFFVLKRTGSRV